MGSHVRNLTLSRCQFFADRLKRNRQSAARLLPGARSGASAYLVEQLEPRVLLAADPIAEETDINTAYLNNPYIINGMGGQLDSLLVALFGELEQFEGQLDIAQAIDGLGLDIDLPGLLDRETNANGSATDENGDGVGFNDHHTVELENLLDMAAQIAATADNGNFTEVATVGEIDLSDDSALKMFDYGANGFSLTDVIRNAFEEDIKAKFADGALLSNVISQLDALSESISVSDPTAYAGTAAYVLDVTAGGFRLQQETGSEYDLSFDLGISISRSDGFSLDLGRNADLLGFDYGADAAGVAGLPAVSLTTLFAFDGKVQVDLTIATGDLDGEDDGDDVQVSFTDGTDIGFLATSSFTAGAAADANLSGFNLDIGFLEIVGATDFLLSANARFDFGSTVSLSALGGLNPTLSAADFDGDLTATLTIVADLTSTGNFADLFDIFDGISAEVTLAADPFDPLFGSQAGSDPRTAPAVSFDSDFEDYFAPFVNVTSDAFVTLLAQFRTFLFQFQNAPDLFGFALPFADAYSLLGDAEDISNDVLDWAGGLEALLGTPTVFNDPTPVAAELFDIVNGAIDPNFDSLQDLIPLLDEVLDGALLPYFDPETKTLNFGFSFANSVSTSAGLDFDFNFGNLEEIGLSGGANMTIAADLSLSLLFGIDLGGAAEVAITATEAALAVTSLYTMQGGSPVSSVASMGKLTNGDVKFRLKVNGVPGIEVDLAEAATSDNTTVADLAADLQAAIDDAIAAATGTGEDDLFTEAQAPTFIVRGDNATGRLSIATPDGTFLTITAIEIAADDFGSFGQLGFSTGAVNDNPIEARSSRLPANGILSGAASFDLIVDGSSNTIEIDAALFSDNTSADDLLDDLQAEIDAEVGANVIEVVRAPTGDGGYRLVLAEGHSSVQIDNVNGVAAEELGLEDNAVAADVQLVGDRVLTFANSAGQVLPASGQLANDLVLSVTIDGVTYGGITVHADDTDGTSGGAANDTRDDLVDDIRSALQTVEVRPGVSLAEFFDLGLDGAGRLVVTSFFEPVNSITITETSAGNVIHTAGTPITGTLTTGLQTNGQVPGNSISFSIEATATGGATTVAALTVDTTGNTSLADFVDDLNAAIAGSSLTGDIVAGLNGGRLTISVVDDALRSVRIIGLNTAEESTIGLDSGASAVAAPGSGVFVDNASFSASITATADGSASANLGFLGIEMDDIGGGVTAAVTGSLTGGSLFGGAFTNALDLDTLFDAVSGQLVDPSDPSSEKIIVDIGGSLLVSGSADITFGDLSVTGAGVVGDILTEIDSYLQGLLDAQQISLEVADITNFDPAAILLPDLSELDVNISSFFDFDFNEIQHLFGEARDFLAGLMDLEFLGTPLPFVGLDLSQGLGFVAGFTDVVDDLLSREVPTIQDLTDAVLAALEQLGISDPDFLDIDFDVNSPAVLSFDIDFERSFGGTLPLNFSLADLGLPAAFANIANLSGSANLAAQFGARAGLSFGIDITDLTNPDLYINTDETGIEITGFAEATEVSFIGALGPLAALIDGGSIRMGGTAPTNRIFAFDLGDLLGNPVVADDGTIDLDEVLSGAISFNDILAGIKSTFQAANFDFNFDVDLPIFVQFGGQSVFIGNLSFDALVNSFDDVKLFLGQGLVGDIDDIFQNLQLPDFDILTTLFGEDFLDNLGLLDTIQLFVEGIDLTLGTLGDLFTGELFGLDGIGDVPFIGDALESAGEFFDDIRNELIAPLAQLIDETPEFVANIFGQILGLIQDTIGEFLDGVGSFQINFLDETGALIDELTTSMLDGANNVLPAFTALVENLVNTAFGFEILFQLGDEYDVGVGNVDFGIPAFGLDVDGELEVAFKWALVFGLGINKEDGFYLALDPNGGDEISLEAALNLPDGISLTLGFLKATATNLGGDDNGDPFDNPALNDLYGNFGFDIDDDGDGRLGFAEIPSVTFGVNYGVAVDVALQLELGFGGVLGANAANIFPSLLADVGFEWGFGDGVDGINAFAGFGALPELPEFSFDRLGLQLGSFLTDVLSPVVDFVQEYLDPILPLINLLVDPIPVISDLNGEVSLLDIAAEFGLVNEGLVTAIEIIVGIANTLNELDLSGGEITLWIVDNTDADGAGTIDGFTLGGVGGVDLTNPSNASLFKDPTKTITEMLGSIPGLEDVVEFLGDDVFSTLLEGAANAGGSQTGSSAFNLLTGGGSGAGLVFPLFDDPAQIFGLLFGRDATIIGLNLPPLVFGFDYSQFFSIWGPIGVTLGGAFSATFNFDFAYDTAGVRKFAAGGFDNPLDLFEGFYFLDDTFENPGVDTPEITLYGEITAALAINIGVASAGVGGGIFGTFNVDWHDPNGDLKMRFAEIAANVIQNDGNVLCIFDYSVFLEAKLFVFVEALFGLWEKRWDFGPSLPLIDETITCDPDPLLATPDEDNRILRLNMGEFSEDRTFEGGGNVTLADVDEHFYVFVQGGDIWVEAVIDGVVVDAQNYGSVSKYDLIIGWGGLEDDKIFMDGTRISGSAGAVPNSIRGDLKGGVGNDELVGGEGGDTILGEAGNDHLGGHDGNDLILGGTGNDCIKGGDDDDDLFGELGFDTIYGGGGADLIDGGEDDDVLAGGAGADVIWARAGDDLIAGGGGADVVSGGIGNDTIWGDLHFVLDADCVLQLDGDGLPQMTTDGTDGADFIAGGEGDDWISADGANDFVWGDSDFDAATDDVTLINDPDGILIVDDGEGATNQTVVDTVAAGIIVPLRLIVPLNKGGSDVISGGAGDDVLFGEEANDVIRGDRFDDLADTGDRFSAGLNTDSAGRVLGAAAGNEGSDVMDGFRGADVMFGSGGDDWGFGGAGTDFLIGNAGGDRLRGAAGRDVIFGDDGSIQIFEAGDTDRVLDGGIASTYDADTFDPYELATANPTVGGNDNILGGIDDDIIFGGLALDVIDGQGGEELIFGDHGVAKFTYDKMVGISLMTLAYTTDTADGGSDTIKGGLGEDIIFGGTAGDTIDGDLAGDELQSDDVIVADFGEMTRLISQRLKTGFVAKITTVSGELSGVADAPAAGDYGNDTVTGGGGADVIFGGIGQDILVGGASGDPEGDGEYRDIIVGDDGRLSYVESGVIGTAAAIGATTNLVGDNDHAGMGDATAIDDEPLGLTLDIVETVTVITAGDADTISGGAGDDIILAGGGADTVFGDDDYNVLTNMFVATPETDSGIDIVIGDQGQVLLTGALIRVVRSTATNDNQGGGDTVGGNFGDDVIIGGVSGIQTDTLGGDEGDDIILGDEGVVLYTFDTANVRDRIFTTSFNLGATDVIRGNAGDDVGIGGTGADQIQGDNEGPAVQTSFGDDLLIGDQGELDYVTNGSVANLRVIFATDTADADGGIDTIQGDAGRDIIIGGVLGDLLYGEASNLGAIATAATGHYDDTILGDEGRVFFLVSAADGIIGPNGAVTDTNPATVDVIETTDFTLGAGDTISGGRGSDTAMGGTGADTIYGDNVPAGMETAHLGDDVLIGDQGQVINALGVLDTVDTTDTSNADGAADTIYGNAGNDIILGGVGGDLLHGEAETSSLVNATGSFNDIILGDEGTVDFDAAAGYRVLQSIRTTDPALGSADFIFGNRGADIALGGTAGDTIHGDVYRAGGVLAPVNNPNGENLDDLLGGDHGELLYVGGQLNVLRSIDTAQGGMDIITGDDGGDIILGGAFGDRLYGEHTAAGLALNLVANGRAGNDIVLGDNGQVDWGLDVQVEGLSGILADTNPGLTIDFSTLDRVMVIAPNDGGSDIIFGNGAQDVLVGGTAGDLMWGDSGDGVVANDGDPIDLGSEGGEDGPDGSDAMFGDHAVIYKHLAVLAAAGTTVGFNDFLFSTFMAAGDGGAGDLMFGNGADDMMLGQQGDDLMFGGVGDDDMTGGHNVIGGIDEMDAQTAADFDLGPTLADLSPIDNDDLNDAIDGGAGDDSIAGDNAKMFRIGTDASPRMRLVGPGGVMYSILTQDFSGVTDSGVPVQIDETIAANVDPTPRSSPDHVSGRFFQLLDHSLTIQNGAAAMAGVAHSFGNDVLIGGLNDDEMWGGLGDDIMQGDGLLKLYAVLGGVGVGPYNPAQGAVPSFDLPLEYLAVATDEATGYYLSFHVVENAGLDGDDYMEGNGGNDRMYGNLGSDDMIGGSSSLYGLGGVTSGVNPLRPDGADLMYGSVGKQDRLVRNAAGADASGFDSDVMIGDNANIYRLVDGAGGYRTFNYDLSPNGMKIVPRPVDLLDYGYVVNFADGVFTMTDGFDTAGFGAGDLMYGEAGDDFMFGQTGDDVLFGNAQNDSLHGGRGNDILLGGTGEDGILGDDGLLRMSRLPQPASGNNPETVSEPLWGINEVLQVNLEISTPGNIQRSIINVAGSLRYGADLLAFRTGTDGLDQQFNDIIFGGLHTDWIHGGDGDDAISGAEALAFYHSAEGTDFTTVNTLLQSQQRGSELVGGATYAVQANPFWFDIALYNPGEILRHEGKVSASQPGNQNFSDVAAEFAAYDSYNPRDKVFIDPATGLSVPIALLTGSEIEFILNFDATEGPNETNFPAAGIKTDGDDRIFGDLGNDWIVGGTGRDNMYGGRGNDLLNMDDDHDTNGMLNDDPDAFQAYADIAYGGAGRDVLILNTGADRSIDWVGEFNSYIVPFSPFGAFHISRNLSPHLAEYLLDLSEADGADQTGPDLGLYLEHKFADIRTDDPDPLRNLEPFGELGMVRQQDFDWGEQTGAPNDPQAGNLQGQRDIMRRALFADEPLQGNPNNGNVQGFGPEAGIWSVSRGVYNAAPSALGGEGISIFFLPDQQPTYMELLATVNVDKDRAGWKSNGYIIFDYQSETNFKFAGINAMTDKIEIGQRTASGWVVLTDGNMQLRDGTNYNLTLVMHGTVATIYVNGGNAVSWNFGDVLNDGYVGLGVDNAKARFDNWQVQKLPPVITFEYAERAALDGRVGAWSDETGILSGATGGTFAVATRFVDVALHTMLEIETEISGSRLAGLVFDWYSATNYKFAGLNAATGEVVIGHVTERGVVIDESVFVKLTGGGAHGLKVHMLGGSVSVELDGKAVLGHVFYSIVNDGQVGVFADTAGATVYEFAVRGDDPAYATDADALTLEPGGAQEAGQVPEFLAVDRLRIMAAHALNMWADRLGKSVSELGISADDFQLAILSGDTLATSSGGTIYVDADAAGAGWFVDETPEDDKEFDKGSVRNGVDLLSALLHEIGHLLGYEHDDAGHGSVLDSTIAEGERLYFDAQSEFEVESSPDDRGTGDADGAEGAGGLIVWSSSQSSWTSAKTRGKPDFIFETDRLPDPESELEDLIAAE